VGRDELEVVMRERGGRPLVLIDIAVPRDVEPSCAELEGVSLYDIDDLQALVMRNLNTRAEELPRGSIRPAIRRCTFWTTTRRRAGSARRPAAASECGRRSCR